MSSVTADPPLVVVADDDDDILMLLTTVLSRAGFHVLVARNGSHALELVRERRPRLAVLDVSMPELDGLEVLGRMRTEPKLASIPVILLSARAQEADVARGYAAGASKYLRKPFDRGELVAAAQELAGVAAQRGGR